VDPSALQKLRPEREEDEGVLLEWENAACRAEKTGATA
jgi:hypothetical protein